MARQGWDLTPEMFLAEDEVARLLGSVRGHLRQTAGRHRLFARIDELIVEVLVFSGLRNGEFCALALADTTIGHGRPVFLVHRSPGEQRIVHLPRRVNALVERYVRDVRPLFLPDGTDPRDLTQPLLFSEHRRPYKRSGLYRRVVRVLTRAGLGGRASVQLLRHTYGYLAYLRTGGNLLFVQRQLGHTHPMVTAVYARFAQVDYGSLADRVAGALADDANAAAIDTGTALEGEPLAPSSSP